MAGFACVHHIEIGVVDGPGTVEMLRDRFTFRVQATRFTSLADQWLLVKNDTRFLITSLRSSENEKIQRDPYVINWAAATSGGNNLPTQDSAFNIAFQVKDLDASVRRLNKHGAIQPKPIHTFQEADGGCVRTMTVKSCVGDIYHTLIQKENYSGGFLPGFADVTTEDSKTAFHNKDNYSSLETSIGAFDHVALCAETNTSMEIIGWYESCFGMKRFLINGDEDDNQGLILSTNDVGLRLRAMEYWKCSEVGLVTEEENAGSECTLSRLSIVIGEGLPPLPGSTEENQIEAWMKKHGGPGIQHVAISTQDIKNTVCNLKQLGAEFAAHPPAAYYTEVGRLNDIIQAGEDVEILSRNGILIDTEADGIHDVSKTNGNNKEGRQKDESYLLQIFTKPLLKSDPFFLEFIQREGASGFGSGNVAALYRSVQGYIVDKQT